MTDPPGAKGARAAERDAAEELGSAEAEAARAAEGRRLGRAAEAHADHVHQEVGVPLIARGVVVLEPAAELRRSLEPEERGQEEEEAEAEREDFGVARGLVPSHGRLSH